MRTEIQRKQRDAESKQMLQASSLTASSSSNSSGSHLSPSLEKALALGANGNLPSENVTNGSDSELQRLKESIAEKEKAWKSEYERVTSENEALRSRAGEAILAAQWRSRYENCLREKQELSEKLQLYTKLSNEFNSSGSSSNGVDQAFADMQQSLQASLSHLR